MNIEIRPEQPEDVQSIHDVTVAAFLNADHADHTEQFIVKELRNSNALSISLVAIDNKTIVGHVAVSPVTIIDGSDGFNGFDSPVSWYGLGPISVLPSYQNKGIGSKLMKAAIKELENNRANGCVLLGDPDFYQRFGFAVIEGLILPGVPAEYFLALVINGEVPQGEVAYHEAFLAKG
jgi:putative acetyltransferase